MPILRSRSGCRPVYLALCRCWPMAIVKDQLCSVRSACSDGDKPEVNIQGRGVAPATAKPEAKIV